MKKTFFLAAMCFVMATVTSCNQDRDMNEQSTLESTIHTGELDELGAYIPDQIVKNSDKYLVGFMVSEQTYTIKSDSENTEKIALLNNAVKSETPVLIYLKKGTYEIAKVEKVSESEVSKIKSSFMQSSDMRAKRAVTGGWKSFDNFVEVANIMDELKAYEYSGRARDISSISFGYNRNGQPFYTAFNPNFLPTISGWFKANYRYTKDGCFARATVMSKFLISKGYSCEKVWVYGAGSLKNNWSYHVAVSVSVRLHNNSITKLVIDPSLNNAPMSGDSWKKLCLKEPSNSNNFILRYSPTNVFYRSPQGVYNYDSMDLRTNCVLEQTKNTDNLTPLRINACMK
ncbi:hypothetical protein D1632_06045 [Chryseobacterium nematophagum]|uniref:Protein glutaminase domain-containing protein n=1 Tax=Chryseobacterium nematophagum TaxID=2305228 RepID=A0A3M7L8Y7_9FLAO|nr:protein-glutamine glutaminase family protein [Chryseobacterium nematophagum]RMZ59208.1 hypothetical protein D1632_06045 [Chryseobacterium nematophagum]